MINQLAPKWHTDARTNRQKSGRYRQTCTKTNKHADKMQYSGLYKQPAVGKNNRTRQCKIEVRTLLGCSLMLFREHVPYQGGGLTHLPLKKWQNVKNTPHVLKTFVINPIFCIVWLQVLKKNYKKGVGGGGLELRGMSPKKSRFFYRRPPLGKA